MQLKLLHLLHLTDPTLPIGGYAHSYGLETYVQLGIVNSSDTAKTFVTALLQQSIRYTDAAVASLAFDAAAANDWPRILNLNDMCTAVKLPMEPRLASHKLGMRLLKTFKTFSNTHIAHRYSEAAATFLKPHYCIAFGIYAQTLGIEKADALTGFYYNAAVGLVTNCVKLIPLGQGEGQVLLFSLHQLLNELVQHSLQPDERLIGLSCAGSDIRCMQHERLFSRLYMS